MIEGFSSQAKHEIQFVLPLAEEAEVEVEVELIDDKMTLKKPRCQNIVPRS